ncbi:MAG: hypothetical protein JWP45_151 [Mucilaginibacter sp.]|nr:hypothetical protein [Mucilaginibacter sp.]
MDNVDTNDSAIAFIILHITAKTELFFKADFQLTESFANRNFTNGGP